MRRQPFIISEKLPVSAEKMFALWTNPDHLSHWFGPAGVKIVRHSMDLRVGGIYHFCLQTPDGQLMWGKWIFREIDAPRRLVWIHSFSDERGGLTRHPLSDERHLAAGAGQHGQLAGSRWRDNSDLSMGHTQCNGNGTADL